MNNTYNRLLDLVVEGRKDEGALFDRLKDMAKAFMGRRKGGPGVERLKDDPKSTSSQRGNRTKPAWSDEKRNFNRSMGGDQR
jgi:hypothetical protein